ncbi:MAG: lysine--tRNA ligase [Candidatus Omnitrophica bacterium CG11_big_fil_rev_8_21_14_0_20_45_26]|uniref:Lysine--tRNA ligase n=1 Tax=Candidatus Abzuiibacterium crystallinum TaxID=1974748 RepID=A0A2H0LL52_9BACT|nr:MAG: lysine--tRNA ligase [Candidatus Omnitrophica bacterium CG11_big_fil_rev_8_21_14_0_20_45_26]PIW63787.1 MAG: lysine--tRNA ligase [Candidatus Omnitrophica bacterium CG12_big_fil_rev_8_21_14_0_65_45_16]
MESASDILKERLEKVKSLRQKGVRLFGGKFDRTHAVQDLLKNFEEGQKVSIAGRLLSRRAHGKSAFGDIKDESGKIQIYMKLDDVGAEAYQFFSLLDLGDILGIQGQCFLSRTGEKTVRVLKYELLTKIVQMLPEKWHGLRDVELRYRHRYVDLIVNDDVRETFKKRSEIIRLIRKHLDEKGFMEVETPMMQPIPGGARARPFKTHHHTLHRDLYLRVAPELYLKRLLVGGFEKVYEINRNFRNEGISVRHNPEFTMIELYQAYADYEDMMNLTEELISNLAEKIGGGIELPFGDLKLNFKRPWKRVSFYDILKEKSKANWRQGDVKALAKKAGLAFDPAADDVDILNEAFDHFVQPELIDPTFVIDFPTVTTPLAKRREDEPDLCYRFELFIARMELANAFSELNDSLEQRERLTAQKETIGDDKAIDEDFLLAMEYGMPPAGGLGIGIDRLVMLLTNAASIRDVILFPQLRKEKESA